ncbi:MAG: hypothetical protein AB8B97_09275 [Granulosicoccus sp.]
MSKQSGLNERLQAGLQKRIDAQRNAPAPTTRYQWREGDDEASSLGEATTRSLTEKRFPCAQCGAVLHYAIGTQSLECEYCGHGNAIALSTTHLQELDLHHALEKLQNSASIVTAEKAISCPNCAAHFELDAHIHAGECPFCGTDVVTETSHAKPIKPKGVLPFSITAEQARKSYQTWLGKRWFAPNALKKYARSDADLNGVYIPYWTYDSDTATAYRGQRGEVYYVTQRYTTTHNGRTVTRTRQVPKVRWYPASGRTSRHFDDVLVGATKTLPRKITDWLAPWDLKNLKPYTEDYLAGFSSEVYQVDLDEGFTIAQTTMDKVIRDDVRQAIGGDQQRIQKLSTKHSDTTFKHVLLPLWVAGFQFRGKTYRFVVNGRTGKVRGERPYSVVKIVLAVIAGIAITASVLFAMNSSQALSSSRSGFEFGFSDRISVD